MVSMARPACRLCSGMPESVFQSPDTVSHSPSLQIQACCEEEYVQLWDKLQEEVPS